MILTKFSINCVSFFPLQNSLGLSAPTGVSVACENNFIQPSGAQ